MRETIQKAEDVPKRDSSDKLNNLTQEYVRSQGNLRDLPGLDEAAIEKSGKLPPVFVCGDGEDKDKGPFAQSEKSLDSKSENISETAKDKSESKENGKSEGGKPAIDHFNESNIPADLKEQLSEKNTGVKIDSIDFARYKEGNLIVGYKDGKQTLLKGNNLYVKLDQKQLDSITANGGKLDERGGKPGWYMKDGDKFRKMLYEDYRFSQRDGTFLSRSNDGINAQTWSPKEKDIQGREIGGKNMPGKMNALGAFVQTNENGDVTLLRRPDDSTVRQTFAQSQKPGDKPQLINRLETDANGKIQVWLPDKGGSEMVLRGDDGQEIGRQKDSRLEANGNLSWQNDKGDTTVVRGNGTVISTGKGQPDFKFDNQGRITDIVGKTKQHFDYVGQTEKLASVSTHNPDLYPPVKLGGIELSLVDRRQPDSDQWTRSCQDQHGRLYNKADGSSWTSSQGEKSITPSGVYVSEHSLGNDGKKVTQALYPNGKEELVEPLLQTDAAPQLKIYDAHGRVLGTREVERGDQSSAEVVMSAFSFQKFHPSSSSGTTVEKKTEKLADNSKEKPAEDLKRVKLVSRETPVEPRPSSEVQDQAKQSIESKSLSDVQEGAKQPDVRDMPQLPSDVPENIFNNQAALEKYLKDKYNATFSGNGERHDVYGDTLISRRPTKEEVQVASKAVTSFGLVDKKQGIKFVFAANNLATLNNVDAIYQKQAIYFPPKYNIDKLTGQQYKWFEKDTHSPYRMRGGRPEETICVENNIKHELAHSIDDRRDPVNWKENKRGHDLSKQFGFVEKSVAERAPDGSMVNIPRTAVEGKNDDYFLPNNGEWAHYDKAGRLLGSTNFDQMAAQAEIPPGSIYWTSAHEASADVKTALYGKRESRENVNKMSPAAYKAAVLADQDDIDFTYGKNSQGKSLAMRAMNGRIRTWNQANLASLDALTRQILTTKQ